MTGEPDRFGLHDDIQTAWAYLPPAMLTAERQTMTIFLARLQQDYGSVAGFAAAAGITGPALHRLRDALLE